MITKADYCNHVITQFARTEGLEVKDVSEEHILTSSNLAVAMEYLGLLKDPGYLQYAQSRGGIHTFTEDGKLLSLREFLELLPQ